MTVPDTRVERFLNIILDIATRISGGPAAATNGSESRLCTAIRLLADAGYSDAEIIADIVVSNAGRLGWTRSENGDPESPPDNPLGKPSISMWGGLWKPVSDHGGGLGLILPAGQGTDAGAYVLNKEGVPVGRGHYYGPCEGSKWHGGAVYRFDRPGGWFETPCYLKVGDAIYWVPQPGMRWE